MIHRPSGAVAAAVILIAVVALVVNATRGNGGSPSAGNTPAANSGAGQRSAEGQGADPTYPPECNLRAYAPHIPTGSLPDLADNSFKADQEEVRSKLEKLNAAIDSDLAIAKDPAIKAAIQKMSDDAKAAVDHNEAGDMSKLNSKLIDLTLDNGKVLRACIANLRGQYKKETGNK